MFDRVVANSPRLDRVHAEGIHLQAKLTNDASWGDLNETHHQRIEANVREVLQGVLPTLEVLPDLSKGGVTNCNERPYLRIWWRLIFLHECLQVS